MKKLFLFFFTFLLITSTAQGQPRWVKMMKSDQTNYFKTIKRFDRYWKKHFIPNEEEEMESKGIASDSVREKDPRPWLVRCFQSVEQAKEKSNELSLPYRNFYKWKNEMLPYVKSNGKLMSMKERMEAWKALQEYQQTDSE